MNLKENIEINGNMGEGGFVVSVMGKTRPSQVHGGASPAKNTKSLINKPSRHMDP